MSDFWLDFRDRHNRQETLHQVASGLKFCDDTQVHTLENNWFSLVLTRIDEWELWGPYQPGSTPGGLLVCLAGRIALEEQQWEAARKMPEPGGLACKAIYNLYSAGGIKALEELNGNFLALVHDPSAAKFHLVTDRCGMYLAYGKESLGPPLVFCSHPDVLAAALGESQNWDRDSLAEFLMTSRLTFPFTYYKSVRAMAPGFIYTINLQHRPATLESQKQYFDFNYRIDPQTSEWTLAEELAGAFRRSIRRRTWPFLGRTGVGLSGGLDSRAVLSAAGREDHIQAFCLFDEPNPEYHLARKIAAACGIKLHPLARDFEYYGLSAELGVRLSGGTGCITCNHFLGIRERLKNLGLLNLLTGCYCDYLLKGLALNTRESWLGRIKKLTDFEFEFYDPYSPVTPLYQERVTARLQALFPESTRKRLSEEDWLQVERRRIFPLAYEQDLAQRVIPQRTMPWSLPMVDNDILAVYLKMPCRYKLNASLFKKMLTFLCPAQVCAIPDSNTGAPVNASWPRRAWHRYQSSIGNRMAEKFRSRMSTSGSWPNWRFYLERSQVIQALWTRPNPVARELFIELLGQDPFARGLEEYASSKLILFQRLFTQKLWLDQSR